jgi:hypothetical protein
MATLQQQIAEKFLATSSRGGWHRLNLQTTGHGVDKVADR